MKEFIKRSLFLGIGLVAASREQVEKIVDDMVKKGEISSTESKELLNDLISKGEDEQKRLSNMVKDQIREVLDDLNIATKEDINKLEKRLETLEKGSLSGQE
ncbi:MAG: polyhydroxyalkanoate synthesis regulator [Firmicutes bacterium HGW-Firmicutes-8]|nr:MAG: polyhydroxyalkanoate synthesis regulator [Firmicutes bacterium HGW-Firmicutes-8]